MPPELDQMNPGMNPQGGEEVIGLHGDEPDREGAMAKADLFKLANYAHKLFQQIDDDDQLEGWVQAKITKAADYIASVYHYLEYEMKFSDYGKALDDSDVLSESQKAVLKNKLMEAKSKVKELKKAQAEKVKETQTPAKKVAEGVLSGGHTTCAECGGTGMVYEEPKAVPDHVKAKVEKYNRQAKAFHAASKRIDANKNGIPDEDEMEEGFEAGAKSGSTFKTRTGVATKTDTGVVHKNTSHSDEEHGEANTTHAKAKSAADKKAEAPKQKKSKTGTWGMEGGEKFDNRKKTDEAKELKGKQKNLDVDDDGDIEADDLADLRAGKKKVKEAAKPSAGLSKAKKSAVAKKAKAGGDIGKPGKSFDDVAEKAGGGKKGKAIAAAAMWKNIKRESQEELEEAKKAKKDYDKDGKIETGPEEHAGAVDNAIKAAKAKETVKESAELDRIKQLTQILKG